MRNPLPNISAHILLVFLLVIPEPSHAQRSNRQMKPIRLNADLVVTWAQITSHKNGAVVRGLSIDDFILREDNKPQIIDFVDQNQSLSIVILVDGMVCIWPPELEFRRIYEALRYLGGDAEIALMAWDSEAALVQPMTTNLNVIAEQMGDKVSFFHALNGPHKVPRPQRDHYRPGEAIYQAAEYLEKHASPERRKIIILIAWSAPPLWVSPKVYPHTSIEVSEILMRTGATVYGLYLTEKEKRRSFLSNLSDDPFRVDALRQKSRRNKAGSLEGFVKHTDGDIVEGKQENADDLLSKLTGLISSSYTIGYYPQNTNFDGGLRRINLNLSKRGKTKAGKVEIKTRSGYHAFRPSIPEGIKEK